MNQSTTPGEASVTPPLAAAAPATAPKLHGAGDSDACPNCGASMWGEFCFACGQSRKGLVRRFTSIMGDFMDTVLSIDNRLWRTLAPLYFKPGQLTIDYIAGRRVRHVTPFRLFFFLCILSFLALRLYTGQSVDGFAISDGSERRLGSATTAEEVDKRLQGILDDIEAGRAEIQVPAAVAGASAQESLIAARARLDEKANELRAYADQHKTWLAQTAEATAEGAVKPPRPKPPKSDLTISLGDDGQWDPAKDPIALGWLPNAVNASLNDRALRARDALNHARENPRPLIEAFFGAIPPVTFVLIPLFALLLKLTYLLKRRLYMEHMLTALHSHAFIFLSLFLIVLAHSLHDLIDTAHTQLRAAAESGAAIMASWVPIYLLIAQKRIYRQGWLMTIIKFGFIGFAYMILLALGLGLAVILGLFTL